jgi:hypothetical protein
MPDSIVVEVSTPAPILVEVNESPAIEVFASPGAGGGGLEAIAKLTVTAIGQTSFTLPFISVSPHLSQLYLNGEKATYLQDYILNSTQLTWLGIELELDDELELYS